MHFKFFATFAHFCEVWLASWKLTNRGTNRPKIIDVMVGRGSWPNGLLML